MKIIAIVQARLTSKRLPGKTLKPICGIPMIELLIQRLSFSKKIDQIVIAIPKGEKNIKLNIHLKKKKYQVFQGDEKNVLKRFLKNVLKVLRIPHNLPQNVPGSSKSS